MGGDGKGSEIDYFIMDRALLQGDKGCQREDDWCLATHKGVTVEFQRQLETVWGWVAKKYRRLGTEKVQGPLQKEEDLEKLLQKGEDMVKGMEEGMSRREAVKELDAYYGEVAGAMERDVLKRIVHEERSIARRNQD